ncbi:Hypothetical_protein [Hexamita inflata]|uniref:Hypothetical_protein n=1 Tax=Hexamita inflata TaxID=28002 RepID=A0AA86QF74_9EUKA|nr:Hypothetical protein HINF_LOCUS45215 [Hexamita inflata]
MAGCMIILGQHIRLSRLLPASRFRERRALQQQCQHHKNIGSSSPFQVHFHQFNASKSIYVIYILAEQGLEQQNIFDVSSIYSPWLKKLDNHIRRRGVLKDN